MTRQTEKQRDRETSALERRRALHARALELLRQGPSLMTMLEAMQQAEAERGGK